MSDKIAAVWARVSTENRQEPSLPSQVADVKTWLEEQGWTVPDDKIIMTHWTSKNTLACPDMQTLLKWVRNREVGAVGLLHLDRFVCRMGQMAQIMDIFREAEAEILAKNSPVQTGTLGEAMALLITLAKAFQVDRADEGSKDGLHKRATMRGLPTSCQNPYGYRFDESRTRLIPNENWENRNLMVRAFLQGETIHGIRRMLHERAIHSPKGLEWWPDPTIWLILVDTVNFGEYRALKRENIEPKERRGKSNGMPTYGNTSSRKLEGIPLSNIVVENPIITKEEYEWILARMAQNKANAKRNGKHNFLLKGMIQYELDGRRYHGRHIRDNIWCYEYPDNGYNGRNHPRPYINGKRIEAEVETKAKRILADDAVLGSELDLTGEAINKSKESLKKELRGLERRENANTNAETQLLLDKNRYGTDISDEAYKRALERLQTERNHITERKDEVTREIRKLNESSVSMTGLKRLRANLGERINSDRFEDRRYVLEILGTRVTVTTDAKLLVDFAIPKEISAQAIALSVPLNACPQY
jgi:hypothetical protein